MSSPTEQSTTAPPIPPTPPDDNACCQSGCVMCVYDLYQEELDRHRLALAAWQARHEAGAGR
ncbi:MAG: oxidoreductase-like protein [Burkholderiaceae bacterium]|nr:oxidoreductase-like protein [Burkholderiaceae bacterium]